MSKINEIPDVAADATTFKITLNRAVKLIEGYINEFELNGTHPKVPDFLGGTIKPDGLDLNKFLLDEKTRQERFKGLVAWFCWEQTSLPQFANFFLAFDVHDYITIKDPYEVPDKPILARPYEIFRYDRTRDQDIMDVLKNHGSRSSGGYHETIKKGFDSSEKGTALYFIQNFRQNGPRDRDGKAYNGIPFGLFENKYSKEIEQFLEQPKLANVRYYLGYDPIKKGNNIRVILVGVDKEGRNLVPSDENILMENGNFIIQKSWPPGN